MPLMVNEHNKVILVSLSALQVASIYFQEIFQGPKPSAWDLLLMDILSVCLSVFVCICDNFEPCDWSKRFMRVISIQ